MSENTTLPAGLCGNRQDHDPHPVYGSTVGDFFCTARQEDRLPYAAERRRNEQEAEVSSAPAPEP